MEERDVAVKNAGDSAARGRYVGSADCKRNESAKINRLEVD